MISYVLSKNAHQQLQKLPRNIQRKFLKQLNFLLQNQKHPSLRSRKMSGSDKYEARIDRKNRLTYLSQKGEILIITIGPHDEGLGKK
jgi:mRNA-degrading endonuclease RelE of RelBE toxin-antitoxin system